MVFYGSTFEFWWDVRLRAVDCRYKINKSLIIKYVRLIIRIWRNRHYPVLFFQDEKVNNDIFENLSIFMAFIFIHGVEKSDRHKVFRLRSFSYI